jgi:hypothetical protein
MRPLRGPSQGEGVAGNGGGGDVREPLQSLCIGRAPHARCHLCICFGFAWRAIQFSALHEGVERKRNVTHDAFATANVFEQVPKLIVGGLRCVAKRFTLWHLKLSQLLKPWHRVVVTHAAVSRLSDPVPRLRGDALSHDWLVEKVLDAWVRMHTHHCKRLHCAVVEFEALAVRQRRYVAHGAAVRVFGKRFVLYDLHFGVACVAHFAVLIALPSKSGIF